MTWLNGARAACEEGTTALCSAPSRGSTATGYQLDQRTGVKIVRKAIQPTLARQIVDNDDDDGTV